MYKPKTGQVGTVLGIRAAERVLTLSVSADASAIPAVRIEMHTWVASADDLSRIPALREYADSAQHALSAFNPAGEIQKMFSQIPGLGEQLNALADELKSAPVSLTVKTRQLMYLALPGPAANTNAPLIEMEMDLAGVSGGAIDPAVFEVPSDYQAIPPADIVKAMNPAPGPEDTISAPAVISKVDPEYTEEARAANLSGTVRLSVVVDKEGVARNIRVLSSLGSGLGPASATALSPISFLQRPG